MKRTVTFLMVLGMASAFSMTANAQSIDVPVNRLKQILNFQYNKNINDNSGNGFIASVLGAALSPDRFEGGRQACDFDGDIGEMRVPHDPMLNPEQITVATWFIGDQVKGMASLVNKMEPAQGNALGRGYALFRDAFTDAIRFEFYDTVGKLHSVATKSKLGNDEYHHVAATFDGLNLNIYYDGVLEATERLQDAVEMAHTDSDLVLANDPKPNALNALDAFKGSLDEVRIHAAALTSFDIERIVNRETVAKDTISIQDGKMYVPGLVVEEDAGIFELELEMALKTGPSGELLFELVSAFLKDNE